MPRSYTYEAHQEYLNSLEYWYDQGGYEVEMYIHIRQWFNYWERVGA